VVEEAYAPTYECFGQIPRQSKIGRSLVQGPSLGIERNFSLNIPLSIQRKQGVAIKNTITINVLERNQTSFPLFNTCLMTYLKAGDNSFQFDRLCVGELSPGFGEMHVSEPTSSEPSYFSWLNISSRQSILEKKLININFDPFSELNILIILLSFYDGFQPKPVTGFFL